MSWKILSGKGYAYNTDNSVYVTHLLNHLTYNNTSCTYVTLIHSSGNVCVCVCVCVRARARVCGVCVCARAHDMHKYACIFSTININGHENREEGEKEKRTQCYTSVLGHLACQSKNCSCWTCALTTGRVIGPETTWTNMLLLDARSARLTAREHKLHINFVPPRTSTLLPLLKIYPCPVPVHLSGGTH